MLVENVEDCLFQGALANGAQVGIVVTPRESEEGGWRAW